MDQITSILEQQLGLLAHLKQLIIDESDVLSSQDGERLLEIAKQKNESLNQLQQNNAILALPDTVELIKSSPELLEKSEQGKRLLNECKSLNQHNSELIEKNIASVNRLSQALQASKNSSSLTYDDKGHTSTMSSMNKSIEA
ncbi:flagellar protein FlgN [Parashewanella curva]|uniref:Flagellar protein FlgN n=1 Tax=Parashewanella curva TaxID=2338552 RepID=A0A3L8Q3D3_9GAMM|nr:flagellar protein FlgN [Parashewanella curva]RLV61583.1 flagellar protein FlgN [Parashewanella curva]